MDVKAEFERIVDMAAAQHERAARTEAMEQYAEQQHAYICELFGSALWLVGCPVCETERRQALAIFED